MDFVIRDATLADIGTIRSLADRIWRACYPGIISLEQIEYMLGKMYAPEAIRADLEVKGIRYLLIGPDGEAPLGFAAYGPGETEGEIFLHKLYIDPGRQRLGLGSALIREIGRRGRLAGARAIVLRRTWAWAGLGMGGMSRRIYTDFRRCVILNGRPSKIRLSSSGAP